ncbi:MAG: hypothetical protein EOQ40_24080 [Mesorhizobium sp.]|nr:MAG: hypothetical protein EOQ40_24080 [Mesorhizobium sp.]
MSCSISNCSAAAYPPAGSALFFAPLMVGESIRDSVFLPVTMRGEMPGRAMRGSANWRYL